MDHDFHSRVELLPGTLDVLIVVRCQDSSRRGGHRGSIRWWRCAANRRGAYAVNLYPGRVPSGFELLAEPGRVNIDDVGARRRVVFPSCGAESTRRPSGSSTAASGIASDEPRNVFSLGCESGEQPTDFIFEPVAASASLPCLPSRGQTPAFSPESHAASPRR
jgi:hypothetical protein